MKLLLIPPKYKVNAIPKMSVHAEINRFLSEHDVSNLRIPTKSASDMKNNRVDTVKRTENLRRLRIIRETIERIPAKMAQAAQMPKPIILSE